MRPPRKEYHPHANDGTDCAAWAPVPGYVPAELICLGRARLLLDWVRATAERHTPPSVQEMADVMEALILEVEARL